MRQTTRNFQFPDNGKILDRKLFLLQASSTTIFRIKFDLLYYKMEVLRGKINR